MSLPHARSFAPAEDVELREWLESLDFVLQERGSERAQEILRRLRQHARQAGVSLSFTANTPYVNTIPASEQPPYPGSQEIEMCPPIPLSSRFARTTMASAFQRAKLLMRLSISWLPG